MSITSFFNHTLFCFQVVHNYGHGGAGITLHWGCALEAADIVRDLLTRAKI